MQYSVVAPCGLLTYIQYAPCTVLTTPCLACVLLRFANRLIYVLSKNHMRAFNSHPIAGINK